MCEEFPGRYCNLFIDFPANSLPFTLEPDSKKRASFCVLCGPMNCPGLSVLYD